MRTELTAERLREALHYEPETGVFTWRTSPGNGLKAGAVAGSSNGNGYLQIRVDGVKHRSHRLAWLYMTGVWPASEIDHRNRVKSDNAFSNLRLSTRSLNLQNQTSALKNNSTGFLGVSQRRKGVFVARIRLDGKSTFLGQFDTPEVAHAAYLKAKMELHPGSVA